MKPLQMEYRAVVNEISKQTAASETVRDASGFFIHAAQAKKPTATAEVIVILVGESQPNPNGVVNDYIATQTAVLKSRAVAQAALRHGKLDQLASLKDKDAVATVMAAIKVERSKNPDNPILSLSVVDLPSQDAVVVLEAILAVYRDYVADVYKTQNEIVAKDIKQVMSDMEKKFTDAEANYDDFIKNCPVGIKISCKIIFK